MIQDSDRLLPACNQVQSQHQGIKIEVKMQKLGRGKINNTKSACIILGLKINIYLFPLINFNLVIKCFHSTCCTEGVKNHTHWVQLLSNTYRGITRTAKVISGVSCKGALSHRVGFFGILWGINRILQKVVKTSMRSIIGSRC